MVDARLRELERAANESPDDARAWLQLGRALRLSQRHADARIAFTRARAADPCDLEARAEVDPSSEELAAMRPVAQPATGSVATTMAAFSADGELLAAGGTSSRAVVWSTRTWAEVAVLEGVPQPVAALAFSPDGLWIACAGREGEVALWPTDSLATTARDRLVAAAWSQQVDGLLADLAWLPHGRQLVAAGAGLSLIDASSHEVSRDLPEMLLTTPWNAVTVAPRPDRSGSCVALAGGDGRVVLYDPESGDWVGQHPVHDGEATSVAFSGDGAVVVSGGTDGDVVVIHGAGGEPVSRVRLVDSSRFERDVSSLVRTRGVLGHRPAGANAGVVDLSLTWHAGFVAVTTGSGDIHVLALGADSLAEVCRHRGPAHFLGTLCWNRSGTLLATARGSLSLLGVPCEPQAPELGGGLGPAGIECDVPPPQDDWLV